MAAKPIQPSDLPPSEITVIADDAYRRRFILAFGIMVAGLLAFLPLLNTPQPGDVPLYQSVADDLFAGKAPYRDRQLEYPPYAIAVFALPRVFGSDLYSVEFIVLAFVIDAVIKALLFVSGRKIADTKKALMPLLFYTMAVPFIQFFYLQRYDVWPALICLLAIWLFSSGQYLWSGLAIAIGIGVKLYPVVFVPPLFFLAVRQNKGRRFATGLAIGLLPIAVLGLYLPWWRFAQFQGDRGLQVESLYASVLWLARRIGNANINWVWPPNKNWVEVQGPLATTLLPWSRFVFAAFTAGSAAFAAWIANRSGNLSLPRLARLLLIPLLGFIAFNTVLSPQYMIWLLPLAAIASLEGNPWTVFAIPLATMLTPIFYPTAQYDTGLSLFQTSILLLRNLVLIAVWAQLMREQLLIKKPDARRLLA